MHADNRRIDRLDRGVMVAGERVHDAAPYANSPPANEAEIICRRRMRYAGIEGYVVVKSFGSLDSPFSDLIVVVVWRRPVRRAEPSTMREFHGHVFRPAHPDERFSVRWNEDLRSGTPRSTSGTPNTGGTST